MKKRIVFIVILSCLSLCFTYAQGQEHMKFMGIPLKWNY